jgi:nucleotide-binding universal stress UspA family protein
MLRRIVVPLDGTHFSARAIPVARAIAGAGKADLRLVGVAHSAAETELLRRHLAEAAQLVAALTADGPPGTEVIIDDDPATALLEIAGDPDTVLCFASHDHLPVATTIMHSIGSLIIERASHPFIVVSADPEGPVPPTSNDVVVAVDGVEDPGPLLATAVVWARHLQAPLRVVTVYEPVPADIRRPDHYTRHHGPPGDPDTYLVGVSRRLEEMDMVPVDLTAIPDATSEADGLTRHLHDQPTLLLIVGGRPPGAHIAPGMLRHLLREMPLPILVVNPRLAVSAS